ncbi:clathrin heavy chain linker domain-containing protein 1-like [Hydractinia symbiolongicarpus]|uniref:clathrin heavy chain linker domain-containing protein 1-like n=1 Tax=Hydractinia symbiolongicarpus TaxID=13093 RepID=UPI002549EE07|nr:clathrin heavy chain linker domain-containing protein 1-like [Hydractinia symbiolongicarpus]
MHQAKLPPISANQNPFQEKEQFKRKKRLSFVTKQLIKSTKKEVYQQSKYKFQQFSGSSIFSDIDLQYGSFIKVLESAVENFRPNIHKTNEKYGISGSSTAANLRRRKLELETKLILIQKENKILKNELRNMEIEEEEEQAEKKSLKSVPTTKEKLIPFKIVSKVKKVNDMDLLDVEKLRDLSEDLEKQKLAFCFSLENYGVLEDKFLQRKKVLLQKEEDQEKAKERNVELKEKIEIVKELLKVLGKIPDSCSKSTHIANVVSDMIKDFGGRTQDAFLDPIKEGLFDSDEPNDQNYTRDLVKYEDQLNFFFQNKDYARAAQLAANSPNGMFRTYTTFLKFKNVKLKDEVCDSPAILFCKAVMGTSHHKDILSAKLSLEFIKCALNTRNNRLVRHWMCSKNLTISSPLGDILFQSCKCTEKCSCGLVLLALNIYVKLKTERKVVFCHLKLRNFSAVLNCIHELKYTSSDCVELFSNHPSVSMFYLLSKPNEKNMNIYITLPVTISVLLKKFMLEEIVEVLSHVYQEGLNGKDLLACLLEETYRDEMNDEKWMEVLNICETRCIDGLVEELHACLVTRTCLGNATIFCLKDYIS